MYKMGRRQLYLVAVGVDVHDGKPPVVVGEGWQRRTDLLLASSSVQTRLALNRMRVAQDVCYNQQRWLCSNRQWWICGGIAC